MRNTLILLTILSIAGCESTSDAKTRRDREYAYVSVKVVSDVSEVKDCFGGFQMDARSTWPSRTGGGIGGQDDSLLISMQKQAEHNGYDTIRVITGSGGSTVAQVFACSPESKERTKGHRTPEATPHP